MSTPAESIPYRRLPGSGSSAFEHSRLYHGPDHLLLVASNGYSESYRRFYFRDIQGITLRRTMRGQAWNGVWGFLTLMSVAIVFQVDGVALLAWSVVAGIFLLLLGLNIGRGPTCVCQIHTAVQTRPLPPLNRLRRARKILAQLRPLIIAAQEAMSAEELQQRIEQARRGMDSRVTTSSPLASAAEPVLSPGVQTAAEPPPAATPPGSATL